MVANYQINGSLSSANRFIVSDEAMSFLVTMERFTRSRRQELLLTREQRQREFDKGNFPDFLDETKAIRECSWRVKNTPSDLTDRRVEITGPVDRKMIINALRS